MILFGRLGGRIERFLEVEKETQHSPFRHFSATCLWEVCDAHFPHLSILSERQSKVIDLTGTCRMGNSIQA